MNRPDTPPPLAPLDGSALLALPEAVRRTHVPWRYYGAVVAESGTTFRLFAPQATEVLLLHDGNNWGETYEPLTRDGEGVWTLHFDANLTGCEYKYRIRNDHPYLAPPYDEIRVDPFSLQIATHAGDAGGRVYNSVVVDLDAFSWTHREPPRTSRPMSIYELHLGAFCDDNYRVIAQKMVDHVGYLGFTHVQIMPPFQTPIHESWGYLVGTPYAIYNRHGTLADFCWLVNHLHSHDLGVIVDVPLGFSIQDWDSGIAALDGTDVYHHAGLAGWNDQWHTRIYNHTADYVRDYLTGLCAYLHHELGIDGLRIDAVAAQIFKDYDRGFKAWERTDRAALTEGQRQRVEALGGDMELPDRGYWISEAVDFSALEFLRECHERLQRLVPSLFTIAEESRRVFPRLATPVAAGGLGFTYAQNMGEMHRVRQYLHRPIAERRIEEIESILLRQTPEVFVNAMNTHDECANGKLRLVTELGNHVQLIGLAALCWFRPGAPMIFMGDEFCEEGWFDVHQHLDWAKTGPGAALHQQQMTHNICDLNRLLQTEPALARQASHSMDRNGSNNEEHWFSFVRWGGEAGWDTADPEAHRNDLICVRSENDAFITRAADIHVPAPGEYQVIYNSIDERYIGQTGYNRHDPYWSVWSNGHALHLVLAPYQNLVLKRKEAVCTIPARLQ